MYKRRHKIWQRKKGGLLIVWLECTDWLLISVCCSFTNLDAKLIKLTCVMTYLYFCNQRYARSVQIGQHNGSTLEHRMVYSPPFTHQPTNTNFFYSSTLIGGLVLMCILRNCPPPIYLYSLGRVNQNTSHSLVKIQFRFHRLFGKVQVPYTKG